MAAPRWIEGHLIGTAEGRIVAVWRCEPPAYNHLSAAEKAGWCTATERAIALLPDESMILGVRKPIDPRGVAAAMVAGVDTQSHPAYAESVRVSYERLKEGRHFERRIYIAALLPRTKGAGLAEAAGAARTTVARVVGLPPARASRTELRAATGHSSRLARQLCSKLGDGGVAPASAAECWWLLARAAMRGTSVEPSLESFDDDIPAHPSPADLGAPLRFEGGKSGDPDRPAYPNYLRIDAERGTAFSRLLVLSRTPGQWEVPGGELLARLDEAAVPLDWAVRIRPVPHGLERERVRKKKGRVAYGLGEYDAIAAGVPPEDVAAAEDLALNEGRLSESKGLPGVEFSVVCALGADSLTGLRDATDQLRSTLKVDEYHLQAPIGHQDDLWRMTLPGSPTTSVASHYLQHGLPDAVAGLGPLTGSGLGDPQGPLIGMDIDSSMEAPVLWSPAYGPAVPASQGGPYAGNFGMAGKARGGKSQSAKGAAYDVVAAGGQVATVDKTRMMEWGRRLAAVMPGRSEVIEVRAGAALTLDPLRVFPTPDEKVRFGTGVLTLFGGVTPLSAAGGLLEGVTARVVAEGGVLADVLGVLDRGEVDARDRDLAAELAGRLRRFGRVGGLYDVVFGKGRPFRLGENDYTCFCVPDLSLPREEELAHPERLTPDHVFSLGLLYLVNAVCRAIAFADRRRFCLIPLDEVWYMTRFAQGQELMLDIAKNGPKENAALGIIAHRPLQEIPPEINDLLTTRFLFRMDAGSAVEGLEWIGEEPTPTALRTIAERSRRTGECIMEDRFGRRGLMRWREPYTKAQADAMDTSIAGVLERGEGDDTPALTNGHRRSRPSLKAFG